MEEERGGGSLTLWTENRVSLQELKGRHLQRPPGSVIHKRVNRGDLALEGESRMAVDERTGF